MPSIIGSEYLRQESLAEDPWRDAELYQPYEAETILLPENSACLAVKTYLQMCKLPFDVKFATNAEYMSSGGRTTKLPFLRVGAFFASEFEPIVNLVENKGISLTEDLTEFERSEARAYLSLTDNIFTYAELYISYMDEDVYENVTKPRTASAYNPLLGVIQNWRKKRHALKQLDAMDWKDLTMEEVVEKVATCCNTLDSKLGDKPFMFGDKPVELDAMAFGHIFSILTTPLPNNKLAETIRMYPGLVEFCKRVESKYFVQFHF
ncbi:metaxin-2-like [Lutzomyia longipalpis]|uniref:metaxin-2-like n=1 Tax=Lutzomyia longipalpis TaxID=7200 RepID=UPI00248369AF|nr:metaxin-2-like [Lutzomyia longipalpis]